MMKKVFGFSLLEAMVALVIIAILAAMALPSYLYKITREQIEKSLPLAAETAQPAIAMKWKLEQKLPENNQVVGLPDADKIVNNYVKSVAIENGAIHMTFGNRANDRLKNKVLSLRPAVIADSPLVPITWVCADAEVPDKMTVHGNNRTTIDKQYLPLICRARAKN
jgi:type IV pilus assembly protein PilA